MNSDLHAEFYTMYNEDLASNGLFQPEAYNARKQSTVWFTVNFLWRKATKASS